VSLQEFTEEIHRTASAFRDFYLMSQRTTPNPEFWPSQMNEAEWYEQWLAFVDQEDKS